MTNVKEIIKSFEGVCPACGRKHETAVRDVRVGSGLVHRVGEILTENGFPKTLYLVADTDTLAAADGIRESLAGFEVIPYVYPTIRVATLDHVRAFQKEIGDRRVGILSVGTGSVNDVCRQTAAYMNLPLCIFGTAPSMDGFASYSSPLVDNGFKSSYPAKSPEVIIGDTAILAKSPRALKAAGFGDMMAKYVGLVDWEIADLLVKDDYCPRVAALTRKATDDLLSMADQICAEDEEAAGAVFSSLLLTGLGMSFMKNSRPASGAEHVVAHLIECLELREGKIPNYHGEDIGVCTLAMLDLYRKLTEPETVRAHKDTTDLEDVYAFYGNMADEVKKYNTPDTVVDLFTPEQLEGAWQKIRAIVRSVPSAEEVRDAMARAGCKLTVADIGKPQELFDAAVKYSPFMRRRLTLLRMRGMFE